MITMLAWRLDINIFSLAATIGILAVSALADGGALMAMMLAGQKPAEELVNDGSLRLATQIVLIFLAALMLFYLALRASALSPARAEARLQSLTARIRPRFLFNSLNAIISLIRPVIAGSIGCSR